VLTLSSADLNIYNLSPGTAADSNIIKVTATSNNATGYVITATVGDNTHSNPSYSNTSLNHIGNTGNTFTSLATNASLASLTTDNTWGYSISDNGSTWSNYSGLPLYTADPGKTLKELNTNGTTSFDFKIAAKASSAQPSGEYRNVINFTLTTNAAPVTISDLTYMQDFATLSSSEKADVLSSMTAGAQYQLKDSRDQKDYYISKLADGNVWMTQNLDHDIVTTQNFYTNENTDIGYNASTGTYGTATWNPVRATYSTATNHVHAWCQGGVWDLQDGVCSHNFTPESYDPGNLYWNTTYDDSGWDGYLSSCDFSTSAPSCDESLNPLSSYTSSDGTAQYHLGNYYNWTAALAMNDSSSITTDGTLVEQSICPAGWTLPRVGTGDDSFQALWEEYGWSVSSGFSNYTTLWSSPLYFAISGYYSGTLIKVGNLTIFWSPVALSPIESRIASIIKDGAADPTNFSPNHQGFSIRCIARPVSTSVSGL
jgi:uncharacterized protein (TIGR02145 family)